MTGTGRFEENAEGHRVFVPKGHEICRECYGVGWVFVQTLGLFGTDTRKTCSVCMADGHTAPPVCEETGQPYFFHPYNNDHEAACTCCGHRAMASEFFPGGVWESGETRLHLGTCTKCHSTITLLEEAPPLEAAAQ